uniref:Peptidase A1 domain-containing protein n=2 Tax=Clastoptera arizonana TaxID=38151 RepID=A0A1B6DHP4_9HEMI
MEIEYGAGSVTGIMSMDTTTIGGVPVPRQMFVEAYDTSQIYITKCDGVFGLGHIDDIQFVPPFYNIVKQNLIPAPIFSFYLNKGSNSHLLLGGINESLYSGEFTYVKAIDTERPSWQFNIKRMYIGDNQTFCKYGCIGFVDTGSVVLASSKAMFKKMIAAVDVNNVGQLVEDKHFVACEHDDFPNITIVTPHGKNLTLTPRDYIIQMSLGVHLPACYIAIAELPGNLYQNSVQSPLLYLGSHFMEKYYTQFDLGFKKIGFALKKSI